MGTKKQDQAKAGSGPYQRIKHVNKSSHQAFPLSQWKGAVMLPGEVPIISRELFERVRQKLAQNNST